MVEIRLLGLVQADFPLETRPFACLAEILGATESQIIGDISDLKARRLIREIGPVVCPQALGFQTTLVAMKVKAENLETAENSIANNPGISHAYIRENFFNLWVTLAVPVETDLDFAVQELGLACGADDAISLAAIKTYKLKALFGTAADTVSPDAPAVANRLALTGLERRVINAIQRDLPVEPEPFNAMATEAGLETTELLAMVDALKSRGVIRRYGANINHRKAGYAANAMACWKVPADQLDEMGGTLASRREVSHCYSRRSDARWPYNLYAMIHAATKEECRGVADEVTASSDAGEPILLFSSREIKKSRNRYAANPLPKMENRV
ncbi:Lrp/AsnC family transcriptional regulator [Dehalogenimonas formicexedens]|nr:Lrp/AsnC family transcriptional regulator [Dehalogenimonas formicexedens]